MITYMRITATRFFQLALMVFLVLSPAFVAASEIAIRPFLIDETLTPRDTKQKLITLTSAYEFRKAVLYATVNEITIDSAGEIKQFVTPVMTDRTNTVTSWIEISRGRIEVPAGETREVPLTIRVHPFAEPGEYHVFIGLVEAKNRPAAEAAAMAGDAKGVIVKVTVSDERVDGIRISGFMIDRFITGEDDRLIEVEVENAGELTSAPSGEIIFYDTRGVEVTSVPINTQGVSIAPGQTVTLLSQVPASGELGRIKANVSLRYGNNQAASLFDTTSFYLIPVNILLLLFGGILIASIFVALLFRRVFASGKDDDGENYADVTMYVRDGHEPNPQDHDIDLKNN
jgi:hypothetical protein